MHIDREVLGDNANYIMPEATITVEFYGEEPVGIELPVDRGAESGRHRAGIKRATASAQIKPATLETGLVVQVPPFVSIGDVLRISTETGEYLSRRSKMDVSHRAGAGWIEVVAGSMFSGKSEELIRRLRRAQIAKRKVQIFKPKIDNRYSDGHIMSHSAMRIAGGKRVVGARAARAGHGRHRSRGHRRGAVLRHRAAGRVQRRSRTSGKRVIVAGLDQDYLGKPFEPMPQLLAIAEYITKTLAICMVCGAPANHTQRLVASSERVLVGAQGTYEARCRHCFDPRLGQ